MFKYFYSVPSVNRTLNLSYTFQKRINTTANFPIPLRMIRSLLLAVNHDFDTLSREGRFERFHRFFQLEFVSYQTFGVDFTAGHHGQGIWIAARKPNVSKISYRRQSEGSEDCSRLLVAVSEASTNIHFSDDDFEHRYL